MRKVRTRPWDAADYLKTDADIDAYLEAVLEDDDPKLITAALGDIAKARGMTKIAADIGCSRESLYKALSANGNPLFATVLKTVNALGLRLRLTSSAAPWLGQDERIGIPHASGRGAGVCGDGLARAC